MDHPFPFDPTCGYDKASLLSVPAPEGPVDFADFWRRTYDESRAIPLNLTHRRIENLNPAFETREIEFDSLGGVRIGGWLTVPAHDPVEHGLVIGHGYGGRSEPAYERGAATLAVCARGFNRSAHHVIPGESSRHVLHGIESRETYSHRGCAADLWSGVSALLELCPGVASRLHYAGTSFGGGIGAMALPWEKRIRKAFLEVPSFGNHALRLQMQSTGSGESVRAHYRRNPDVVEVLAYFDSATAARYIRIPVYVCAALFDPAVPPPGQFAVYNGLSGPRELFIRQAGHFPSPTEESENRELQASLAAWWRS